MLSKEYILFSKEESTCCSDNFKSPASKSNKIQKLLRVFGSVFFFFFPNLSWQSDSRSYLEMDSSKPRSHAVDSIEGELILPYSLFIWPELYPHSVWFSWKSSGFGWRQIWLWIPAHHLLLEWLGELPKVADPQISHLELYLYFDLWCSSYCWGDCVSHARQFSKCFTIVPIRAIVTLKY